MHGWEIECVGSSQHQCHVYVEVEMPHSKGANEEMHGRGGDDDYGDSDGGDDNDSSTYQRQQGKSISALPTKIYTCRIFCRDQGLWCAGGWDPSVSDGACGRDLKRYEQDTMGHCDVTFTPTAERLTPMALAVAVDSEEEEHAELPAVKILSRVCMCEVQRPEKAVLRSFDLS